MKTPVALPALPYPDVTTLPGALQEEVRKRRNLNVFRMLMHSPGAAPSFLAMTDALRQVNTFPADLRELAILRVGHRYGAVYELHHHHRIARTTTLDEDAIAAVGSDTAWQNLPAAQRFVVQMTNELLDEHTLLESTRREALAQYSLNQLADLLLTIGHYQQVCLFLNTFGVAVE